MTDQPKFRNLGDLVAHVAPKARGNAKRAARKNAKAAIRAHNGKINRQRVNATDTELPEGGTFNA